MRFVGCDSYTVGAEWELQLLDCESLDLTPGISTLLKDLGSNRHVKPELIQSCVELDTPVLKNSGEIEAHLSEHLGELIDVCRSRDMVLAGAGTHPFCQRLAIITKLPRYEASAAAHGYIAQTQLAFATHIHVGIGSGDAAIRIMRYLTPCLPVLIALSANSPFWRGYDTSYASYRRRLLAASRSYGIPPCFDNWSDFVDFYHMATRAGSVQSIKDIHWDIRPHPDFGTLEVRVLDSQSSVTDIAFIAGVTRLLVAWIANSGEQEIQSAAPRALSTWIDRENHYRASHWGMNASLIAAKTGQTRPVSHYMRTLAQAMKSTASELGETSVLRRLSNIEPYQCGYEQQRHVFLKRKSTHDVARYLITQISACPCDESVGASVPQ